MGLLSEYVEIGVSVTNYKRFESFGYEIPTRYSEVQKKHLIAWGDKIIVKVSDLSRGSRALVDVECDDCKKITTMRYMDYYSKAEKHGDIGVFCRNCAAKGLNSGPNNPFWDPNKTEEDRILRRKTPEYSDFIKKVLKRDNYTCQRCGDYTARPDLEAHHLDGFSWCIEKRYDITNGVTLCKKCHGNFHHIYGKKHNTKEQFFEWMNIPFVNLQDFDGDVPTAKKVYCIEDGKVYEGACYLGSLWGISPAAIYDVCDQKIKNYKVETETGEIKTMQGRCLTVNGKHLLWWDDYVNMTEDDLIQYVARKPNFCTKKVICITTGEIFDSIKEAKQRYGKGINLTACCKGNRKHAGKLEDGTKLEWAYYDDYISQNECEE